MRKNVASGILSRFSSLGRFGSLVVGSATCGASSVAGKRGMDRQGRGERKVVFKDNVEGLEGDKEPPEKKKRNDDDDDKRIGTGRDSGVEEQENRI